MTVTEVKIRIVPDRPYLKAVANIQFDQELLINDLRVLEYDGQLYVRFAKTTYQIAHNMESVCPLTPEFREEITNKVISAYHRKLGLIKERKENHSVWQHKKRGEKNDRSRKNITADSIRESTGAGGCSESITPVRNPILTEGE